MQPAGGLTRRVIRAAGFLSVAVLLGGCASPEQTAALVVGTVTVAGAQIPTDELEQVYYLGVFDPVEQLPPTIYRVTVRGQSSFLNSSKFGSGWVPAPLIDSLSARVRETEDGSGSRFVAEEGEGKEAGQHHLRSSSRRRLVMFGPEGFREAPRDHRLVIVMGGDPSAYFAAVDLALGDMSTVTIERGNAAVKDQLLDAYQRVAGSLEHVNAALADAEAGLKP
ncbi:MAG: hypothetical protein JNL97_12670 [Verrucomicrobiales bacterium]|nr:hypothetical protein [Verrucomicrobiales bacterium]